MDFYFILGKDNAPRMLRLMENDKHYFVKMLDAEDSDSAVKEVQHLIDTGLFRELEIKSEDRFGEVLEYVFLRGYKSTGADGINKMPFGQNVGMAYDEMDSSTLQYWTRARTGLDGTNTLHMVNGMYGEIVNRSPDGESSGKFIGVVGERSELFLKCVGANAYQINQAWGTYYINTCVDRYGNTFVYKGKCWHIGKFYHIKARVKKHKMYHGIYQTIITRPTILNKELEDV